jgi:putative ABC transport system permease protein
MILGALAVGLFLVLFGCVGIMAWRRPLFVRLAWREASRRRGQSLLVVAGLLIGAAAIAAALVTGDTARQVITFNTYRGAAHVDATVSAGGRPFPAAVADQLAADPEVMGAVEGVQAGAELVTAVANLDRERRRSQVRLMGFDPAAQSAFGAFTLEGGGSTVGNDLAAGEVLLSADLAEQLDAQAGDRLRFPVEGAPNGTFKATVAGVAAPDGPGSYGLRPTVFVPLETLWEATGAGAVTVVRVTAAGSIFDGVEEAEAALPVLEAAVSRLDVPDLVVTATKAAALEEAGSSWPVLFMTAMSVAMAAVVVAAGLALSVGLAHMLAEDRRRQLGVLRALGLRGRDVVRLMVIEGALYSLVAASLGTAVGVGAGRLVASRMLTAVTNGVELSELTFVFAARPLTVASALALGASVTLLTLAAASRHTARMSVVAALRDLPEPAAARRLGYRRAVHVGALVAIGGFGLAVPAPPVRTLAGFTLVAAGAVAFRYRAAPRVRASVTGAALIGWAGVMVAAAAVEDPGVFLGVWAVAVIGVVFGLALLVAANLQLLEAAVGRAGRAGGRLRATLRPPIAELARKPVRTGLAMGAFAMALAVVALLAALQSMLPRAFEAEAGDTDVLVQGLGSGLVELPPEIAADVEREVTLPTLAYLDEHGFSLGDLGVITLMVVTDAAREAGVLELTELAEPYASAGEVWSAMAEDPTVVLTAGGSPGDELTLRGVDGPVTLTVAGRVNGDMIGWGSVLVGEGVLAHFADLPLGTTMLLSVRSGADPEAVAAGIEHALFTYGIEARTTASMIEEATGYINSTFAGIDVFVRLAAAVGVATLGILALRAVVERRRAIGVLRAIGYRRRQILAGLLTENLVLAGIGTAVGLAAGLFTGALLLAEAIPEAVGFSADPRSIVAAVLLVMGAAAVMTVGPAVRAARIPPAQATRQLE